MQIQARLATASAATPTLLPRSAGQAAVSAANTAASSVPPSSTTIASDAATSTPPQLTTAQSARQKMDADYAKAKAEGTHIVADIANGGRFLDLSSLSDDEVAAAALNRDGSFTSDEKLTAQAELAGRMYKTLAPFDTGNPDNTGMQTAIKAIYPTLSSDVRDALGWTPTMLDMGDRIIAATPAGKKTHQASLLDLLAKSQAAPGSLTIDLSKFQSNTKGNIINLTG